MTICCVDRWVLKLKPLDGILEESNVRFTFLAQLNASLISIILVQRFNNHCNIDFQDAPISSATYFTMCTRFFFEDH